MALRSCIVCKCAREETLKISVGNDRGKECQGEPTSKMDQKNAGVLEWIDMQKKFSGSVGTSKVGNAGVATHLRGQVIKDIDMKERD